MDNWSTKKPFFEFISGMSEKINSEKSKKETIEEREKEEREKQNARLAERKGQRKAFPFKR